MNAEEFLGPGQVPVAVEAIERELGRLWKESSRLAGEGRAPAVTRACQLNLVICCDGPEEARHATEVAAQVTTVRPSRVVMTVVDPSAGEALHASVTAHCAYTPGAGMGRQVCCEQITLTGGGHAVGRLPGAVLPLLLADLPVVVWYTGDLRLGGSGPASDLARGLIDAADRIVVDSCRFDEPPSRFGLLVTLGPPIGDLSWHRLRGWREMTARFFDDPLFEDHPALIRRIEVACCGSAGASAAEAILLGAWAAGRLGWKPKEGIDSGAFDPLTRHLSGPDGEPCELAIRPYESIEAPGVAGLTLEGGGALFSLHRADGGHITAKVETAGGPTTPRVARLVERDKATLLCRCLESGDDPIYEDTVRLIVRLFPPGP